MVALLSEDLVFDSTLAPRERVVDAVRNWVGSGRFKGRSLPSERSLAEMLQVSRVTVRAGLRDLMRQGVISEPSPGTRRRPVEEQRQPDRFPQPRRWLDNTVAILSHTRPVESEASLLCGWDTFTLHHSAIALENRGYHVLKLSVQRLIDDGLTDLIAHKPAGLITAYDLGESVAGQKILSQCAKAGIPVVVNGDGPALAGYDRVESDHEQGSYEMTRWLLSNGRRRILRFWRFPEDHSWLNMRNAGYERAMREWNIEPLPAVRTGIISARTGDQAEFVHITRTVAGYLLEHLTGDQPVDAILTATDPHAYQVAAACRLFGKIPNKDVWITGFDNTWHDEICRAFEPDGPMLTADKRNAVIGSSLAGLLIDRISDRLEPAPQRVLISPQIIRAHDIAAATEYSTVARSFQAAMSPAEEF